MSTGFFMRRRRRRRSHHRYLGDPSSRVERQRPRRREKSMQPL